MDPDSQIASLAPPGAVHMGEELQALRWHRLRLNLINAVAGPHGAQLMLIDTALILQVELRAPYPAEQRHQYRPPLSAIASIPSSHARAGCISAGTGVHRG